MPKMHTEYAYAKINPYLIVTGRRADGYHTILSHMQAITLCDVLALDWQADDTQKFTVSLECSDPSLACDNTNLICRAAHALVARLNDCNKKVGGVLNVRLEKRIPVAAGLAGGSADAAATLRGLNTLLKSPFATDELCDIAATLGADIPFCVQSEVVPAMTARGIGEILTPTCSLSERVCLVIACHGEGVSTPWAYRQLDEREIALAPKTAEKEYAAFEAALATSDLSVLSAYSYNCFEDVVLPARPAAVALIESMKKEGAVFARMSGSGPSVVGYFDDEAKAQVCADELRAQGIAAHLCRPLS